jgi:hypothetical protein
MLQAERSRVLFPISLDFSIELIVLAVLWPSASNRNDYQESSWGVKGGRHVRKADNLNAIYELTV